MAFLSAVVRWSLRNRPVVLLLTAFFAVFGLWSSARLPIDAIPDLTNVQVQIITSAPALSPVEVEQYVSIPVERALAGTPAVTEIRSLSKYGLSVVTAVFRDGTDIYFARQLISERMREASDAVPARYGKPIMGPTSTALGEIYQFTVTNDRLSLMQLEELLDWEIAPQLRTVPGIVEVNSFGGENKQYQVVLEPTRLEAAGLAVSDVVSALEKSNANAGGGYIEHDREHFVIGTEGLVKSLDDLRSVVIGATPEGVPITIATVGEAQFGPRLRRGAASKDGKGEVVVGVGLMLMGESSRSVTAAVKARIAQILPSLPKGTRIDPFYDRSILVNRTLLTVAKNLAEGAALVIVVLLLLLGDFRAGIVVAVTIPLSMLFAFTCMNLFGVSGNLMSLGAIDFGLIVDGAVIVVENTVRRLAAARKASDRDLTPEEHIRLVEEAVLEVRGATVFGEAIIAIVYLPVLALLGTEGKLFRPMASTVLFALVGAFVFSLTTIPVLASYFVRARSNAAHGTWLLERANAIYEPLLDSALRHRRMTWIAGAVAFALGAFLFTRLGAEFIPQLDEGGALIEARRLPGVSLSESVATGLRVERALLASVPEVSDVVSRTGAPEVATDPMGLEQTDIYIGLKPRSEWRSGVTKDDVTRRIAEVVEAKVPEIAAGMSQPIQMRTNELLSGVRSDVAAVIYGRDLEELTAIGDRVAAAIRTVPGAVDVRAEASLGLEYLRIVPDRAKLARYGLTIDDVNQLTETMSVGHMAGVVLEGERRFDLVVKTRTGQGTSALDALGSLPLKSVSGRLVPLADVAKLDFTTGPSMVNRSEQSRRLVVELNVRGRDLVSVVDDAKLAVARRANLPPGYRIVWGGRFEHYIEARNRLAFVVPIALSLILFMLWLAFRSMRPALLILLNVPFAIVGGVASLWLRGLPFSISAGVGFIALFGVAVLNGLVLVSFAERLEAEGAPHDAAVVQAAKQRLRPVLMTALVASLGFIPMALSHEPGSEVQRPLATVVIGGLFTATWLTLFVMPVIYARFGKRTLATKEQA